MENMFSGNVEKRIPSNLNECYKTDSITHNLWIWSERLEKWGVIFAVIIAILTLIMGIAAFEGTDGVSIIVSIIAIPISAFLVYISFHITALLVGALASIVQHTKISANLALYNSAKENNIEPKSETSKINSRHKCDSYSKLSEHSNKHYTKPTQSQPLLHTTTCKKCNSVIAKFPCLNCGYSPTSEEIPYWCGKCGNSGPFDGNCPTCGSSLKKYNTL